MISAFKCAGQQCSSASQVFVYKTVKEEYLEKLANKIHALKIGPTTGDDSKNVAMGPLYSPKAVEKFLRYQTMAHREAAETLIWGKAADEHQGGHFVTPGLHVMKEFDASCSYQSNVLFCPDLAVYEYEILDQAFEQINDTKSPLSVSLLGDEEILGNRTNLVQAPNIQLNSPTVEVGASLTLAGRRLAGGHRYSGLGICMILCQPKMVVSAQEAKSLIKAWPG
jgi:acyl-CoA reductase-like NAD-dependent aldehyde dehydrogenase